MALCGFLVSCFKERPPSTFFKLSRSFVRSASRALVSMPEEAASFAVFPGYHPPSYAGEEDILPDISTLTPAYEGTAAKSILQVIPVTEEQVKAGLYGSSSVVYYDAEGNQLDNGELAKPCRNVEDSYGNGGGGNGDIWPVDVFQVLLVIVGIIMVRYFLCPEPKKKREAASKLEEYPK